MTGRSRALISRSHAASGSGVTRFGFYPGLKPGALSLRLRRRIAHPHPDADSLVPTRSVAIRPSSRFTGQIPFAVSQTAQVSPRRGRIIVRWFEMLDNLDRFRDPTALNHLVRRGFWPDFSIWGSLCHAESGGKPPHSKRFARSGDDQHVCFSITLSHYTRFGCAGILEKIESFFFLKPCDLARPGATERDPP